MNYRHALCRLALLLAFLVAAGGHAAQARILAQWVEIGPDGNSSVRVVTEDACPQVAFDGVRTAMTTRSAPQAKFGNVKPGSFPVRGCEVAVPAGAIAGILDGRPLSLPRPDPRRIVVFGDTGCRLLNGDPVQSCNDANAWPFPKVAKAAAASRPDLVIHVGDYLYREDACPSGNAGCAGSPHGYGWNAWNADFFKPAAPLFAAAPWVLVRGNHEDCDRAGEGWFRFLDRAPMAASCEDFSGIFVAQLGSFGLVVVDGAKAGDPKTGADRMIDQLRGQFRAIAAKVPAESWLVTHRPPNAMRAGDGGGADVVDSMVQETAFGADMPAEIRLFVSGHIHLFQAVDFAGTYPPQLVVGTGGDNLERKSPVSFMGADINGHKVANSVTYAGFAYMVWDRDGGDWSGTLFDVDGKPINHCRLSGRSLSCAS
jgi:hypothetical protein